MTSMNLEVPPFYYVSFDQIESPLRVTFFLVVVSYKQVVKGMVCSNVLASASKH